MKTKKTLFFFLIIFLTISALQAQKAITLEDIHQKYTFFPSYISGLRSMNDGEHYTVLEGRKNVVKYSYQSGEKVETIFSASHSVGSYVFNSDETKILYSTNRKSIYRHSFTADFYVWDSATGAETLLSENGQQQLATFSPDGNKIAFVRANNLYIKDLTTSVETQITTDGERNKIINGAPDWVYEEEFSFSKAFAWSPESDKLAYLRFDESQVKQFDMSMYEGLYPEVYRFKYPKAGEDNSLVSVQIYNLATKQQITANTGTETDIYLPRIQWTKDNNTLSIIRLNRLQNKLDLLFANAESGETKIIYTEENKAYLEVENYDALQFLKDGEHFVIISESDGYSHLYLYDLSGKLVRQLTKGKWDVTAFLGYNANKKLFYYEAAEDSPLERQVYSVKINGKKKKKITPQKGNNKLTFSKGFKYYINRFSSADTPYNYSLFNKKNKLIRVLEDNSNLRQTVEDYGFSKKEFFTFTTSEAIQLNGWMIKPLDFDASKKYPVFMYQYGGPNSQTVKNSWGYYDPWFQMLAQKGYIVVSVDGRGTGARGEAFRKITYKQLGKYETIDQIETAKYLGSKDYVDSERIGIFGWSYGGFMAASCLFKGADVFKMAIAVAPVTNWRYYDNVYTERYMQRPQENVSGYDDNSPVNFANQLQGKFLLIHGTGDDNVHVQNSMELIKSLVNANKQFDLMLYPNQAHSIRHGRYTSINVYTKMTNYILENL